MTKQQKLNVFVCNSLASRTSRQEAYKTTKNTANCSLIVARYAIESEYQLHVIVITVNSCM